MGIPDLQKILKSARRWAGDAEVLTRCPKLQPAAKRVFELKKDMKTFLVDLQEFALDPPLASDGLQPDTLETNVEESGSSDPDDVDTEVAHNTFEVATTTNDEISLETHEGTEYWILKETCL